jgi:hypothetical protein
MSKCADGPISGQMLFIQNPLRAPRELGMTLRSGDDTIREYIEKAEKGRGWYVHGRGHADNVPSGMFPGRVERKRKHKHKRKRHA